MPVQFDAVRAVVLDLDGVVWRGNEVLPGIPAFFEFLQQQGVGYAFATNNSTKTVEAYVERLAGMGISLAPHQVITSAVATADYVSRHYPVDTPVYIVGQEGIRRAVTERGYREDPEQARLVIVGLDFALTYDKLKTATLRIRAGADFIGTNGDRTFPLPEGLSPGNGSLLALLTAATDVTPLIIGKPEPVMFEVALARLGAAPGQGLMIGDRLETDIAGAQRAGLQTALVLTGTTSLELAQASDIQASGVFTDLPGLMAAWAASLRSTPAN